MGERIHGQGFNPEVNAGDQQPADEQLTPEERTTRLFNQDAQALAQSLSRAVIAVYGTPKIILVTDVIPFPRVGSRYEKMKMLDKGDWWAFPLKIGGRKPIRQSLVVAKSGEEGTAACVRIRRAQYFDSQSEMFVDELAETKQREGDIGAYLGLEEGERAELKYLDYSDALYVVRGKRLYQPNKESVEISSDTADEMMRGLLE